MVYDEKRDMTTAGYVARSDGRQGYRRKVKRAPEEVIRVKLPLTPVISEEDQGTILLLLEKRRQHVVARYKQPRFVYNGYMFCGECRENMYTKSARSGHFYYCSSKFTTKRKKLEEQGVLPCSTTYMNRDKLEPKLDLMIVQKLTDKDFLLQVFQSYIDHSRIESGLEVQSQVVEGKIERLEKKRKRVVDTFFDGTITKEERDRALADVALGLKALNQITPIKKREVVSEKMIVEVVSVLKEWSFLGRDQKRTILQEVVPEIHVTDYQVEDVTIRLGSKDDNPLPRATSPPDELDESATASGSGKPSSHILPLTRT